MPELKYTIGRIRALEARMVDIERLSDAADFQSAFRLLNETDYAEFLSFDFKTTLDLARLKLKNFCEQLVPKNKIIAAFWAKYDYENIKVLIKAKIKSLENPPLFNCGNIKAEDLKEYIFKGTDTIERPYKELIAAGQKAYDKSNDILKMFDLIDKEYVNYCKQIIPPLSPNAKYLASGIEPILFFLYAKEDEMKKIGFILECKKNEIPTSKIKERIRLNV